MSEIKEARAMGSKKPWVDPDVFAHIKRRMNTPKETKEPLASFKGPFTFLFKSFVRRPLKGPIREPYPISHLLRICSTFNLEFRGDYSDSLTSKDKYFFPLFQSLLFLAMAIV